MKDDYYIDLQAITLSEYASDLEQAELLPSRKMLQEDIRQRFDVLSEHGIENLNDILDALKTPVKVSEFARKTGLSEEYLALLKREIASNQPKPVSLKDFPGISADVVQKLEELGIRDTKKLFSFVKTGNDRRELSQKTGIPAQDILELTKLTDVCRIRWVGANFARLLVDSACDTVEKVTHADYAELYDQLMKINEEKKYFKGKFGRNDMKLCVLAAKIVPRAIEY